MEDVLTELYEVVTQRHENPQEGSYTCYLFDQGLDKILKKVGEESAETVVMMKNEGITPDDVKAELSKRHQKSGNLKKFHQVDKNT